MYYIRCETPEENVLAQKLLFEKGFRWRSGITKPLYTDRGQVLVLREGLIRWRSLNSGEPEDCVEIGWGELSRLEGVSLEEEV